ncbi:MAG: hypothetical protein HUK11_10230 [Muribaculaceae bacterium]|nr:hypothetical protein [Muribaculaceae bacterium]
MGKKDVIPLHVATPKQACRRYATHTIIATDSVHPTSLGAAAIARRALIDFPELTNK